MRQLGLHNEYAQFIQPFFFFWESGFRLLAYDNYSSLVSQATPFTERNGLVILRPLSCLQGRNMMWLIRSVLFVARIIVMEYNIMSCLADVGTLLFNRCVR